MRIGACPSGMSGCCRTPRCLTALAPDKTLVVESLAGSERNQRLLQKARSNPLSKTLQNVSSNRKLQCSRDPTRPCQAFGPTHPQPPTHHNKKTPTDTTQHKMNLNTRIIDHKLNPGKLYDCRIGLAPLLHTETGNLQKKVVDVGKICKHEPQFSLTSTSH